MGHRRGCALNLPEGLHIMRKKQKALDTPFSHESLGDSGVTGRGHPCSGGSLGVCCQGLSSGARAWFGRGSHPPLPGASPVEDQATA